MKDKLDSLYRGLLARMPYRLKRRPRLQRIGDMTIKSKRFELEICGADDIRNAISLVTVQRQLKIDDHAMSVEVLELQRFDGAMHRVVRVYQVSERNAAYREYDRTCEELLNQCGAAELSAPHVSRFNQFVKLLFHWACGAAMVVVYSLYVAPQPPSGGANKLPVGTVTGIATPAGQDEGQGQAPAAWNALTLQQKETLLGMANTAAVEAGVAAPPGAAPVVLTKSEMDTLKRATAIRPTKKSSASAKVFYVFEDPMCSACRHIATQLKDIGADYVPIIMPIAFQPGAKEQAVAALCAPDPVKAWNHAMQGLSIQGKPCEKGLKAIEANNKLFVELGMGSTPTLVAPNGTLAQGSAQTQAIAAWVDTHR
jgi:protein-disulfide isomerase